MNIADFVLTFDVKSTKDTGGHRDCCVFFNWQDAEHFYYCHLGASPDPHSGQIMIVKDAPRKAMTENKNKTPWKNETWHKVKVVRESAKGTIDVYFDDMKKPHMSVIDKTYGKGRIGIWSFDDMNDFDSGWMGLGLYHANTNWGIGPDGLPIRIQIFSGADVPVLVQ